MTLCTFQFVKAEEPRLKEKTIYIDPGHGGRDPGAIYKELKESNINLKISLKLKEELEKEGSKVEITRNGDYDLSKTNTKNHKRNDLSKRAKLINDSNCDMYISIHLNSDTSSTWNGLQIFYTDKNKENKKIAQTLQEEFKKEIKTTRNIKEIKNMYLFDRLNKPGVLIEVGFISNPSDREKLVDEEYQNKISKIITKSIIKYYEK
jgi:N-acetylmuramoyl-L-alanine amidase